MLKIMCFLVIGFFSQVNLAIVDGHKYPFTEGSPLENQTRAELFKELAQELRCPKCQNQNLSDSDAMIAGDLRRELYSQIKAGKQGPDIIEFMVKRYGEFVLYRPKLNDKTYVLWYGPMALGAFSFLIFILVLRNRRKRALQESDDQLSQQDLSVIDDLLNESSDIKNNNGKKS